MVINTAYQKREAHVNRSWKYFSETRNITVARENTFRHDAKFYTMGSCFANEIRQALEQKEFIVLPLINPAIQHLFADEFRIKWGPWQERIHMNVYNTFSIRQEWEKVFGLWKQKDDDFFVIRDGQDVQYWDPYRRAIYTRSESDFVELKQALDQDLKAAILSADAVIVTLGLTEVFFRQNNGLATCEYNRRFADQTKFRSTGYLENFENIDRVCQLYFEAFPARKLVLTVSPVGLGATFTDKDVVVANTESKSILRAVAAEISRKWPNVIYWPSYEVVIWNEDSWRPDLRHVHPERVASIVKAFVECHVSDVADHGAERSA